ncbi:MAG: hypothetical protein ABIS36_17810 [Chryseolinea sp.]
MEKSKTSKRALTGLINDSIQEALKSLELPAPGKKVKKVLLRSSKKLAGIFSNAIKSENKKKKKAAKFMEDAIKSKSKKNKKPVAVNLQQHEAVEA